LLLVLLIQCKISLYLGRNVQLPAAHVYSQCGARGAVFCDIAFL